MAINVEVIKVEDVMKYVKDDVKLMVGGFLGVGEPIKILDYIATQPVKNIHLVAVVGARVGGGFGIGKLTANKQVASFLGSHIGTDPVLAKAYVDGSVKVEFNPMGTFIERIRAGGAGLGAVVTPTGLGTEVEEVAQRTNFYGKDYLVFEPVKADVAIIKAAKADMYGNLQYDGTSINTNPTMATAAKIVIAEVDEIVEVGQIAPNDVGTPGIFVDYVVQGYSPEERKEQFGQYWEKMGWIK
ncbi:MAG: malonate decarboxylase subunit alpha [Dethiosulfatibacter sp.]|nr:malonate decarboxylase subunit alpha [Dethiosulfatibacter sp.]